MKRTTVAGLVVAVLVATGAAMTLLAQNGPGPGPRGFGYGGPPKTEAERAARQAACQLECPRGGQCQGPCVTGEWRGRGRGYCGGARNGRGFGYRHGLRDGTGPRSANGTCPFNNQAQTEK